MIAIKGLAGSCVSLIAVLQVATAVAQDGAMPVFLETTVEANHNVGSRLVYLYREHLRKSSSMSLTAVEKNALLKVNLITMDPTDEGSSSVYSVTFTMRDLSTDADVELWYYISSSVGICGSDHIAACAETLAARTSEATEGVREIVVALMESVADE